MNFEQFVLSRTFALSEGSMYERLRRYPGTRFDPHLAHATLIYEPEGAALLERLHREYLDVGQQHGLAMFALTDTWRANRERLSQSRYCDHQVNQDNAKFLTRMRASYGAASRPIFVGGQIGPKGDAYKPAEAPAAELAETFHQFQIDALAEGGVDFLYAATLPALSEAQGIAAAMASSAIPYVLSFVVRRDGSLLDGTAIAHAIQTIDDSTRRAPTGYAINCVHPDVFYDAMEALQRQRPGLESRILSFQANTSRKDPTELDGLEDLETEPAELLAATILGAYRRFGTPFFGGCCGTDVSHIVALAKGYASPIGRGFGAI